MQRSTIRIYLGIYLVSTATLTYEIGLTRLFSLAQGYHFAFMVVSIALMGIGAGGALLMVYKRSVEWELPRALSLLAVAFSIVAIIAFILSNQILFDPVRAAWSRIEFIKILAQYLILSLPFVFSGVIISLSIRSLSHLVHRIYLADMVGAGSGCLLILLILSRSGGEWAVIVASALALAASLLFHAPATKRGVAVLLLVVLLLMVALFGPHRLLEVRMSPYRDLSSVLNFPGGRVVETLFSPSGRLDVVDSPAVRAAPGIGLNYMEPLPPQVGFTVNGGGLSTVTSREGELSFLRHLPSALAYRLRTGGEVFIVESGGGMEALSALEHGASGVWGSETRGVVIEAMEGSLLEFSGGLHGDIHIGHGYGRSILMELDREFDIIQLPMTGTLGSSSTGIRGLQEEYNLTVEAINDYMKHLRVGGILSMTLYLLPPPRQEIKALATVVKALEGMGIERVDERVIAIRSWGVMTLLIKKGAMTPREIEGVKGFCNEERFDLVWYPGMTEAEANRYNRFPTPLYHRAFKKVLDRSERASFYREYLFDLRPATDDSPFFGQTFKLTRMGETYESVGRKWGILIEGGYLLPWILVQSAVASIILIMAPLLLARGTVTTRRGALLPTVIYFSSIGVGFMFMEIVLIQRMIPLLGEPIYAISAVLFTLLVSTGIGSYLSGYFRVIERYSAHALLILPLIILAYLLLFWGVAGWMTGMGLASRFLFLFLFLFPLGAAMGIPFPAGISLLSGKMTGLIPWAWCINGSFSVVSSTLAMIVALGSGFQAVQGLSVLFYLIAWLALVRLGNAARGE